MRERDEAFKAWARTRKTKETPLTGAGWDVVYEAWQAAAQPSPDREHAGVEEVALLTDSAFDRLWRTQVREQGRTSVHKGLLLRLLRSAAQSGYLTGLEEGRVGALRREAAAARRAVDEFRRLYRDMIPEDDAGVDALREHAVKHAMGARSSAGGGD